MKHSPMVHKQLYDDAKRQVSNRGADVYAYKKYKFKIEKYVRRAHRALETSDEPLAAVYGLCRKADRQAMKIKALDLHGRVKHYAESHVSEVRNELVGLLEKCLDEPASEFSEADPLYSESDSLESEEEPRWHVTIETVHDEDGL